ncbi:hypothetical protein [Azospirillum brasilense]|uniref:hypothetical protein n=1 Tax=Azospirillum brasilense TaxID=192 RepID=UPI001ED9F997|nr:hypothetical protein [Azospirillum brasilense]UKJ74919.1 hypothetical protein H1Q64_20585 [Azospirillum brasilense]
MIRRMLTHTAATTLVVAVAAFAFQAFAGGEGVARTAGSLAAAVAGDDHDAD